MKELLTPSILASITALTVSLITLLQFFRNQRFQQKQLDKNLNRSLTTKLYDLRLEHYPRAFEITDSLHREKGGSYDIHAVKAALGEIIDWKKGIVNLLISVEANDSYYELRDCLMKKPAEEKSFSKGQAEKIHSNTKMFRKQLRRDLGFMYREEKARRKRG